MEEILVKYFSGEATENERKEVEEWRCATENNAIEFFEFKKVWLASAVNSEPDSVLLASILSEAEPEYRVVPLWESRLFQLAAAIVVILGIVFTVMSLSGGEEVLGAIVSQNTEYRLPDGSKVTVQKGGKIEVGNFETSRDVTLIGKAFFEVERNPDKPFRVKTSDAFVEVLGTSFVVDASAEDDVEVMVASGKVAFTQNPEKFGTNAMSIQLEKGEKGTITAGDVGIKKEVLDNQNYLAWKTGSMVFKKQPLSEVASLLEDVYGIPYEFENPAIKDCKLTARFKQKDAKEILIIIAETFDLKYSEKSGKYILSGDGCN